ncbi:MAG: hypothetical protein C3F15_12640 [Holophagae bacterium]|nr:MAG: hypothetical protein C3F15_12640 [Holophagae bacterium]
MRRLWWLVVVVVICAAGGAFASAVEGPSTVDLGYPEAGESTSGPPAAMPMSTAELLQELTPAERLNARLSLEGVSGLGEIERQMALQVEALWAEGRFDEAISLLSQLEAGGARLAAGIAWRQPVASEPKVRGADARIGGTRQGAEDVALDFDQETGNLFAVVAWQDTWTMNISTDGGVTWSETYDFGSSGPVDAAVVDQYLYVAYSPGSNRSAARMRRFFVTDGLPDDAYFYHEVADVFPDTILDVSLGADVEIVDGRLYFYFVESNNAIRYYYATGAGLGWTNVATGVTNAASNLDFHFSDGTDYFSWISYWGTDGTGHSLGRSRAGTWRSHTLSVVPNDERVRVSAYLDNVFASYQEDYAGSGRLAASYDVTYNEGADWSSGWAYLPDAGEPNCYGMDITARGGWGTAVIYNREAGFDSVYLVNREGYQSGVWNDPIAFNEFDAFSGGPSFIQYLKPLEAFGVVYLAGDTWATTIPYFDVIGALPFTDGFDDGDTSRWSNTVP